MFKYVTYYMSQDVREAQEYREIIQGATLIMIKS